MKIKILTSDPNSTTSYYRTLGPLKLHQKNNEVSVFVPGQSIGWSDLLGMDILFMDRPDSMDHLSILKIAQSVNCKVIVDWDINPFAMSDDYHPFYTKYTNADNGRIIKEILIAANGVIVENNSIAKSFQVFNESLYIRRNQYFPELLPEINSEKKSKNKRVLIPSLYYLLSDFEEYQGVIQKVISESDDSVEWIFTIPESYKRSMKSLAQYPNVKFVDQVYNPVQWIRYLRNVQPDVIMAPMIMNHWNASKYNNISLDAFYGGGIAIAPDYEGYRYDNTYCYSDAMDLYKLFSKSANNKYEFKSRETGKFKIQSYRPYTLDTIFKEVIEK